MGESQSRYSIVERLTQTKLDLLGAKNENESNLADMKERIERAKAELEYYKVKSENDRHTEIAQQQKMIADSEARLATFKNSLKDKEDVYKQKLAAVEEALKAVKEISAESAAQEKKA